MRDRAIHSFTQQIYPAEWNVSLVLDYDDKQTLGAKLNRMIAASDADIFVLLDDDDWHNPERVALQVEPIVSGEADFTGTSEIYYFDAMNAKAFHFVGSGSWLGGLAFSRGAWETTHFQDKSCGVDSKWQTQIRGRRKDLKMPSLFVAGIHHANTCPKQTSGSQWNPIETAELPQAFLETMALV